ncbi:MAG: RluA family pseudouridine synthase [Odoribacteraceae bacterium]|jgi:23S rRNA pseudouridine1911/1915/1917 synthase|nr:RluA family pseudouridine synthase [Odoribacteraceae bacterium]
MSQDEIEPRDEEALEEEEEQEFEHFRFDADRGQAPLRVDKFLVDRLPNASRTRVQEAAVAGCIRVNGLPVKPNYRVKPGDAVALVLARPKRDVTIVPEEIPLEILHEDDHLLVLDKPPGLVVHPSFGHHSGTLVNALAWHLRDNPLFDADDPRPGLVHRIDKDTSGLLVVAKTEEAKTRLALQFFNKTSERKYIAVCWGNLDEERGTITGNIGRDPVNRKTMSVFPPGGEHGKHAVTRYRVIERLGYVNVVECILETGRTHQIRAHFKSIRHPLFNDAAYGGDEIARGTTSTGYKQFVRNCFEACPRQALHAKTLGFVHPATGEWLAFDSPLPADMETLVRRWRGYTAGR